LSFISLFWEFSVSGHFFILTLTPSNFFKGLALQILLVARRLYWSDQCPLPDAPSQLELPAHFDLNWKGSKQLTQALPLQRLILPNK
jgi:hypothetical protein